jgi:hypothetical protein
MHADAPAGGDEQVSRAPTPPVAVLLQNRTGAEVRELHRAGYWSSVQAESVVVSLIAGAAGSIVTSARLTVLSLA